MRMWTTCAYFGTKRILTFFVATGVVLQFVAAKSTLLSLLRYGDLWGEFSGDRKHCVDVDIEIDVTCTEDQWFVLAYALNNAFTQFALKNVAFAFRECSWIIGKTHERDHRSRASLNTIICYFEFDRVLTVELRRVAPENDPDLVANRALTMCRAKPLPENLTMEQVFDEVEVDSSFPCPSVERSLAYGPCAAIPNITEPEYACMTRVQWMRDKFTHGDLTSLEIRWLMLRRMGYTSMWHLWNTPGCSAWRLQNGYNMGGNAVTVLNIGSFTCD